ncbi:hypothetical protein N9Z83_00275 [Akkermansiaceae bacterium]|nr:hypothetical protein [Akkermansiaceae bacterium]
MKFRLLTFFLIIMAVFAALLIPLLKKAQKSAIKAKARNDMKQVAIPYLVEGAVISGLLRQIILALRRGKAS